jgi:GT2 family glycosyltransferase
MVGDTSHPPRSHRPERSVGPTQRPAQPRVSVVIPSWNGAHLLPVVLSSLARQSFTAFETIVVDNGSTDKSADYLARAWPGVIVRFLECNAGFAAAVNAGIRVAQGEYVALLNNDVELDPEWLSALIVELDGNPELAAVSGKLLKFADRTVLEVCGTDLAWNGSVRHRGNLERDRGQYDEVAEVFSVCAGAALYRRSTFDVVGLFDERLFAYFEDVDWGFRARLAGFGARYTPHARAFHMGSATSHANAVPMLRLAARNNLAVIAKCYPPGALRRFGVVIALHQMRTALSATRRGWLRAYLGALGGFVRMLPHLMAERRRVRRIGNVTGEAFIELPLRHPR